MMFFSVVIPVYNAEKTLRRCLDSVCNQSFTDFEVIMVNDGSSDSSETICMEYIRKDDRFHYYSQENSGVSKTRNAGIDYAKGLYITFLDSDDIYYREYLLSFYEMIQARPDAGNYWCGFDVLDQKGRVVKSYCMDQDGITISNLQNIMTLHSKVLDASPCNKAYRRNLLQDIRMHEELSLGEDYIFNLDYLDANPIKDIVITDKSLYGYYCVSESSLNHRYRDDLKGIYDTIIHKVHRMLMKWKVSEDQWVIFYNNIFYMYDSVMMNFFSEHNVMSTKEKYRRCNALLRSDLFQKAFAKGNQKLNILLYYAYRTKRYEIVRFVKKMAQLKNKMRNQ